MHRLSLSSCPRVTIRPRVVNAPKIISRARSDTRKKPRIQPASSSQAAPSPFRYHSSEKGTIPLPSLKSNALQRDLHELTFRETRRTKTFTEAELSEFLSEHVDDWKAKADVTKRIRTYGIPLQQIPPLLNQFSRSVLHKHLFKDLHYTDDYIERLAYDLSGSDSSSLLDKHLSQLFFAWVAHPHQRESLSRVVPTTTLDTVSNLHKAADLSDIAGQHPTTRLGPQRKIIMHVGPTNSGKTHNALRALAAAEYGLYAGPLRLLAHEIWERLNKGQILPLGMEPEPNAVPDENTNLEVAGTSIVQKEGNPKWARACNLRTGEEQRVVDEEAGLVSCTVEMVERGVAPLDVAVIDEIQMIAEAERGGAWTNALLGINAKELHLCGEERAVPLVEALLKDTGDELIVHRYDRLSPLMVADHSLGGDLSKIQKGDCVVTFSRNSIFKIKRQIEAATGLTCAVVYGGLPPEVRSQQAAHFNSADSKYDVIIGSDAIGMGLNLKIKRIVFDQVRKWTGTNLQLLHLSAFKQIAGRAGRYNHYGENAPGIVTTLSEADLPILRKALELPIEPIRYARVHASQAQFAAVAQALPVGTPLATVQEVFDYVSKTHPRYQYEMTEKKIQEFAYLDNIASELTIPERLMLQCAPIGWRDDSVVRSIVHLIRMYRNELRVDHARLLQLSGFNNHLVDVFDMMKNKQAEFVSDEFLHNLESMHKVLTVYVWLSYRVPLSYPRREEVESILEKVQEGMQWCLESLSRPSPVPGPGRTHSWQSPRIKPNQVQWELSTATSSSGIYGTPKVDAPFGLKEAVAQPA